MTKRVLCVVLAFFMLLTLRTPFAGASIRWSISGETIRNYPSDENTSLDDAMKDENAGDDVSDTQEGDDFDGADSWRDDTDSFFEETDALEDESQNLSTCLISYNSNGGIGYMESETALVGVPFVLPECGFTAPQGKRFRAWNINGVEVFVGNACVFSADAIVSATWEPISSEGNTVQIDISGVGNGVMNAPYSGRVRVDSGEDSVTYAIMSGQLPAGLTLDSNGWISGYPQETGVFTVIIRVAAKNGSWSKDAECTLNITSDNANEQDTEQTSPGHRVGSLPGTAPSIVNREQTLGDNEKEPPDPSSPAIVNQDQTFEDESNQDDAGRAGGPSIVNRGQTFGDDTGDGETENSPQAHPGTSPRPVIRNQTLNDETETDAPQRKIFTDVKETPLLSIGDNSLETVISSVEPQPKEETPKRNSAAAVFRDISSSDWFYNDANWAYQNGIILGVTENTYEPQTFISYTTAVVVLARLNKVDLKKYETVKVSGIPSGQWYTSAANWAKRNGILSSVSFQGGERLPRGKLAVILANYLKYAGIRYSQPPNPVLFADADQMTREENQAFQILYRLGIFKGTGNYHMNPKGYTTRAHLVALLHRLSIYSGKSL